MKYKNKLFYLPDYNRIVFCHKEKDGLLLIGGLSKLLEDAESDKHRGEISVENFQLLTPILIKPESPFKYDFLVLRNHGYRVIEKDPSTAIKGFYPKNATPIFPTIHHI